MTAGYAGGSCLEEDEGLPCLHDDNTVCADKTCFCVAGTHMRAGKCIQGERFVKYIDINNYVIHMTNWNKNIPKR